MKMFSGVTDVRREGGFSVCATVHSWRCLDTSMSHNKQSEEPGVFVMGTIWFSCDCEQNLTTHAQTHTRTEHYRQHNLHPVDPVK